MFLSLGFQGFSNLLYLNFDLQISTGVMCFIQELWGRLALICANVPCGSHFIFHRAMLGTCPTLCCGSEWHTVLPLVQGSTCVYGKVQALWSKLFPAIHRVWSRDFRHTHDPRLALRVDERVHAHVTDQKPASAVLS